jgi:four helix bundle protein
MPFMLENLQVYQRAVDFADTVAALSQSFPRRFYFLVDQLNRAALSIATNLAEGNGRFTKADRKHFFTIARGSIQKCVALLEVAKRRGFIAPEVHASLKVDLEKMAPYPSHRKHDGHRQRHPS